MANRNVPEEVQVCGLHLGDQLPCVDHDLPDHERLKGAPIGNTGFYPRPDSALGYQFFKHFLVFDTKNLGC